MLTITEAVQHLKVLTSDAAHNGLLLQIILVGSASAGKTTVLQAVHVQSAHTEMIHCTMYRTIQELETRVLSSMRSHILLIDDLCVFDVNELISSLQHNQISFIAASRRQIDERCDHIMLETRRLGATNVNENIISLCSPVPPYCEHMTRIQCILLSILHICMRSSPSQDDYRFGRTTLKRKGQCFKQDSKQTVNSNRVKSSRVSVTRLKACFHAYSCLQADTLSSTFDIDDIITSLINSRCITCTRGPTQSKTYLQCTLTEEELTVIRTKANIPHGLID